MQIQHTHVIAAIYHILGVVLFWLISLSCSQRSSLGVLIAAYCTAIGRKDQMEHSFKDPELWPTDSSWHMGGRGTLLKISQYTSHITQERGLPNEPWNQQKKVNKQGAQNYSIVWDLGLCVLLMSPWVYLFDPVSQRNKIATDREKQRLSYRHIVTVMFTVLVVKMMDSPQNLEQLFFRWFFLYSAALVVCADLFDYFTHYCWI